MLHWIEPETIIVCVFARVRVWYWLGSIKDFHLTTSLRLRTLAPIWEMLQTAYALACIYRGMLVEVSKIQCAPKYVLG